MEERGGMVTDEMSDMMMMIVVPSHIFQQKTNHLSDYCFTSLIRMFTIFNSGVCKGILDGC